MGGWRTKGKVILGSRETHSCRPGTEKGIGPRTGQNVRLFLCILLYLCILSATLATVHTRSQIGRIGGAALYNAGCIASSLASAYYMQWQYWPDPISYLQSLSNTFRGHLPLSGDQINAYINIHTHIRLFEVKLRFWIKIHGFFFLAHPIGCLGIRDFSAP